METLGEILKNLREEKGISMDDMAEELKAYGVSPSKSMISRWENNKAEPSMEYARILSRYFNVTLDYLLGLEERQEKPVQEAAFKIPEKFTAPKPARFFLNRYITALGSEGKSFEDMEDDKVIEFANAVLEQIRLVGYKYIK